MKKFHVTLKNKALNKSYVIESQDDKTANTWGQKQFEQFKQSGKVTIVPYLVPENKKIEKKVEVRVERKPKS